MLLTIPFETGDVVFYMTEVNESRTLMAKTITEIRVVVRPNQRGNEFEDEIFYEIDTETTKCIPLTALTSNRDIAINWLLNGELNGSE